MKLSLMLLTVLFVLFISFQGYTQKPAGKVRNPYAVSTYESGSVYWKTPESGVCTMRYKEAKGKTWKNGLDLVYDARHGEYRGSIIDLVQNSEYQVELSSGGARAKLTLKTRNDVFPVGKTTILPEGESDKTIVITESGTPDAYHLVTVPPNSKSVLNLKNVYDNGIEVEADYVIIRGVEIRNPKIHGIRIRRDRHDVVVEQCYITFWGRIGGPITYGNFEGNMDSGVSADRGTWNLTIQRNLIEDPRGGSNDWETGHPAGPQGISISQSLGGNVIRYNDIVSTEDHGFNDAIGGSSNFSDVGNLNRDSDVYGNLIRSVWDDAIEVEGANMNVRIWGNYMDKYFQGVATASTTFGPIYIYRNIFAASRRGQRNTLGGNMFKLGSRGEFGGGRRYFFHNTAVQPNGPYGSVRSCANCVAWNNIFDVPARSGREADLTSDFNYNYGGGGDEKNAIRFTTTPASTRLFVSSYSLEFYPRLYVNSIIWGAHPYEFGDKKRNITDPVVQVRNPMIDGGMRISGFNDDFKGEAPDVGAFEVGAQPLEFGRRAYYAYDEGWAPWERH
jgi:hypothetical protein